MQRINKITLKNELGMEVDIINLGATVSSIRFPVNGKMKEMTATYKNIQDFTTDNFYIGATVGRFANRIANAQFSIDDKTFSIIANHNGHCLHGGSDGFSHRFWHVERQNKESVVLVLISPDGDQGFPGELTLKVTYTLTENNSLDVIYHATSTKDTAVNFCNHCYFNLGEKDISTLSLKIKSREVLAVNDSLIPTGEKLSVDKTDFDFNERVAISDRLANLSHEMLVKSQAFDHCYVIDGDINQVAAELSSNEVNLTIKTDLPGLQFCTPSFLSGEFSPFQALCLEAQNYPDAINQPTFPNAILRVGEEHQSRVRFIFSENQSHQQLSH